jgi:hypothetical protein
MINVSEFYDALMGKELRIYCTDGSTTIGRWSNWTSGVDNEPDGESITVDTPDGGPVEIYIDEIERIMEG